MNRDSEQRIHTLAGHLFREHHGKMVSLLSSKFGYHHIENVLDALQESFEAALKTCYQSIHPLITYLHN